MFANHSYASNVVWYTAVKSFSSLCKEGNKYLSLFASSSVHTTLFSRK